MEINSNSNSNIDATPDLRRILSAFNYVDFLSLWYSFYFFQTDLDYLEYKLMYVILNQVIEIFEITIIAQTHTQKQKNL